MPGLSLRLPDPPRSRPILWGAISFLVHAVVLVVLSVFSGRTIVDRTVRVFVLADLTAPQEPRAAQLPHFGQPDAESPRGDPRPVQEARRRTPVPTRVDSAIPIAAGAFEIGRLLDEVALDRIPVDDSRIGTGRILGPAYGTGQLWVRVEAAELGVVGPSGSEAEYVVRVDSALREKIKAFIDTLPRDSFALPPPPVWTADVGGRTWGVDRNWIYLGDFKLPTALLALLPIQSQANYDRNKSEEELLRIREIIHQAARRADNSKDFRRYIDELRRRRDEEREAERAAATRDTIIP